MNQMTYTTPDGQITLIQGDCLEVLPTLEPGSVDAVVVDPQYGIDYENAGGFCESSGWVRHEKRGWDTERPPKRYFDLIRDISRVQVIWGGNYFADLLPPTMRWLIWDKGQTGFTLADCEMAWTSQQNATRRLLLPRGVANREPRLHWTQKPVKLMMWSIETCCNDCETICDTHMGSATTAIACMRLGRRFIGIEKDPGYYQIAVDRVKKELGRFPLLDAIEPRQKMLEM